MIDQETIRKLRELNLSEVVDILQVQERDTATTLLPFDERMKLIIDFLYTQKHNNRIARLIKAAKFRFPNAELSSIIYQGRDLDRGIIHELATCLFIKNATNIIFEGYTGSGKTYLACAMGNEACCKGYKTRYIRLPDLLMEFEEAKVTSSRHFTKLLDKYSKYQLLIIDEWLMESFSKEEEHFIFELIERRYGLNSTIFCTQHKANEWINILGDDVHAEAINDRIVHNAYFIETGKTNMREYLAKKY